MSLETKTPEFHGPEELPEAAKQLLYDQTNDMVVVRGLVEPDNPMLEEIQHSVFYPALDKLVPDTQQFNEVVYTWAAQQMPVLAVKPAGAQVVATREAPTRYHIDPLSLDIGPLSLSIRADSNGDKRRRFFAMRPNIYSMSGTSLNTVNTRVLQKMIDDLNTKELEVPSSVEQDPGDAVLFMNHPYPTIHRVECGKFTTRAAIASFKLAK